MDNVLAVCKPDDPDFKSPVDLKKSDAVVHDSNFIAGYLFLTSTCIHTHEPVHIHTRTHALMHARTQPYEI